MTSICSAPCSLFSLAKHYWSDRDFWASEIWIRDFVPMEEAFSEDNFKGRSILVGLEMNAKGKELLEWTLNTVGEQGDRVVAVHICHYSGTKNQHELKFYCNAWLLLFNYHSLVSDLKNNTFSLIKVLEDYLETCESLCNLKQVSQFSFKVSFLASLLLICGF